MMRVSVDRRWRVRLVAEFSVPASINEVWNVMADVRRMIAADPFHDATELATALPRTGTRLTMRHRFLGITTTRRGRILRWRPGKGFAYSDLSTRGPRRGFPHVFSFSVRPRAAGTVVRLEVRGRWTARWLGRVVARLWLTWTFMTSRLAAENAILRRMVESRPSRRLTNPPR